MLASKVPLLNYTFGTLLFYESKTIKMKKWNIMKYFIVMYLFLASLTLSQSFQENLPVNSRHTISSASLIEIAYYNKEINLDQRILSLNYYLNDYSKLPDKFKSTAPEKCGTWIATIIFNNFDKLKPETKKILISYGFK